MQPNYKQSGAYRVKYQACLSRALGMVRAHVTSTLEAATSAATPAPGAAVTGSTADSAFALFYGKFRTQAPKLTNVISAIENRCGNGKSDASEARPGLADTIVQVRQGYFINSNRSITFCSFSTGIRIGPVGHTGVLPGVSNPAAAAVSAFGRRRPVGKISPRPLWSCPRRLRLPPPRVRGRARTLQSVLRVHRQLIRGTHVLSRGPLSGSVRHAPPSGDSPPPPGDPERAHRNPPLRDAGPPLRHPPEAPLRIRGRRRPAPSRHSRAPCVSSSHLHQEWNSHVGFFRILLNERQ